MNSEPLGRALADTLTLKTVFLIAREILMVVQTLDYFKNEWETNNDIHILTLFLNSDPLLTT